MGAHSIVGMRLPPVPAAAGTRGVLPLAAALSSAVLFHFGTGLHPVAWLTWVAPLPVLLVAARVRGRTAFVLGVVAWGGGQAWLWPYLTGALKMPAPLVGGLVAGTALLFGVAVLVYRGLLVRGRAVLAMVALPAFWVCAEYGMALGAPHGAWWSLAYTQADVPPVVQTASVTGVWGITFLILLAPAAVAALPVERVRVIVIAGAVTALALGYGSIRLAHSPEPGVPIALISTDTSQRKLDSPEGRELAGRYAEAVAEAAERGAELAVLPEKAFEAETVPVAGVGLEVVTGITLKSGNTATNTALAHPSGARYDKRHLIPGLESDLTPGDRLTFIKGTTLGLIICKDLDFPGLVRAYRRAGATALLAPAWDFGDDAWLHGRMAVVRGVENGLSIARTARRGLLTVSDSRGRILAEARSGAPGMTTLITRLPREGGPTPYTTLGDWAAWTSAALLLLALTGLRRAVRPEKG